MLLDAAAEMADAETASEAPEDDEGVGDEATNLPEDDLRWPT